MLTADEIEALGEAGAMAPSGGNAQPWRLTVGDSRPESVRREGLRPPTRSAPIRLLVEPDEARSGTSFLDVGGYAARFAIGCFAQNVAVTADSLGLAYQLSRSGSTVEFRFTGRHAPSPHEWYPGIAERVTNRRPSDGTPVAAAEVAGLVAAAGAEVRVSIADRAQEITRALGTADVLRLRNPTMFSDMVSEICWNDTETAQRREGLDLRTLELPGSTARLLSLLRRFPRLRSLLPAGPLADTARQIVANAAHMCCLAVPAPLTPAGMVTAGMAMQRLWLEATRRGIAVHPWTVSTLLLARLEAFDGDGLTAAERGEVARLGTDLRAGFGLTAEYAPVFVFRVFHAPPPAARSLRLPWQSFTTLEESTHGVH